MSYLNILRGNRAASKLVTATFATFATQEAEKWRTVAPVATVTVATAREPVPEANPTTDEVAFSERVAMIHGGGHIPLLWAEGYARLCRMPVPSNYKQRDWEHLINNTGLFLDRWGKEAAAAGWHEYDLFAVHRVAPIARYDCMGLLPLLGTNKVTAVSAEGATLLSDHGAIQQWRRRPYDPATAIMVWELV
jgi:hypothetical protein